MDVKKLREDRIYQPISTQELERRWQKVREVMATKGIDCLVMQNTNKFLGGYVRWFTDVPADNGYPLTVIFPLREEMIVVTSGGPPTQSYPPKWALRGVSEVIAVPYFLPFNYTKTLDAEVVAEKLKSLDAKVVGLVGENYIPASFYNYIRATLPSVELIEAADVVDPIKAIKSEEEIALIKKSASIQDAGMAAVPSLLKPGMREFELRSALEHLLIDLGSEEQWIMIGSAPSGELANQRQPFFQNKTIHQGDQVCIMIEVSGPGGYYTEVGRTFCLGDPPAEMQRIWKENVSLQKINAAMLKPGAHPADIFKSNNEFLKNHGYKLEGRLYAHGQGYDLVERPAIRVDEPMLLEANMVIAVHPRIVTDTAYTYCCDNYLITEDEALRIHTTPLNLFVL